MAVSLTMMVGRIGALSGNVMFPLLLQYGCVEAVTILGVIILGNLQFKSIKKYWDLYEKIKFANSFG